MPFGRAIRFLFGAILTLLCFASGFSQSLEDFETKVAEFTLDNGLHFIVVERHDAPVVSFHTYANVGSVDEVKGITGMAHVFEHMAFKGSTTIGTTNYQAEKQIMENIDTIFMALKAERRKGERADPERLAALEKEFKQLQEEAEQYLVHDEFEEALSRAGSVGLNAQTTSDATHYTVSLPSNKIELWMSLESERFLNPVLREFHKEKDVVMEERRLRVESRPIGRLLEEFLAVAYKAHPYGEPGIGHMSDLRTMTRAEAEAFFKTYYTPGNLTIGIVGDVDPESVRAMAQTYFGRIPAGPAPEPVETVEPPQLGERRVVVEDPAQPLVLIGYHKPGIRDEDNAVYDAISDIIGAGRTSRLYKNLVKEKKIAVAASGLQGLPGNKYPGLFLFFAIPAKGHTNAACKEAILTEIEQLKATPVSREELEKAKTRARAGLIRQLASNSGLAAQLTSYEVLTGDWRELFKQLDRIEQVTAEDIQRVAKETFTSTNRTVGVIKTKDEAAATQDTPSDDSQS